MAARQGPIRTAVLGMGMSATVFHIPFIKSLGSLFELYVILERKATPEKSLAREKYGSVKVVTTYHEILEDPNVDLVVISTPNSTHHSLAKAALEAGKHVIVEKPLVPTSQEATELIDLASSKKLVLATYQNRRWDSDFLTLRNLLDVDRVFGDISEFETRFDRFRPDLKGADAWRETSEWGGGVVFDLGSHLIDQVLVLFGTPEKIFARVENSRGKGPVELADAFVAHFYYPARTNLRPAQSIPFTATIRSSTLSLLNQQLRFAVRGTKASFIKHGLDSQEGQLKLDPPLDMFDSKFGVEEDGIEGELTTLQDGSPQTRRIKSERGDYAAWFQNVADAITSGDPHKLLVKPQHARDTIRMIELIYQSSQEERVVQVWKCS